MYSATVIDTASPKFLAALPRIESEKTTWIPKAGEIVKKAIEANIRAQGLISGPEEAHDTRFGNKHLVNSGRLFYKTKNGISVGFGKGLPYAAGLELGSLPHKIEPDEAEKLAFVWRGQFTTWSYVNHPGNKPYRFVYKGTMESIVPLCLMFMGYLRSVFRSPL
jgi:hypothetical protein